MTTKEKKLKFLKHYFKIEHNISNFEVLNIQNDMIGVSFIALGKEFIDPYIDILTVNFSTRELTGIIDLSLAKKHVQDKIDEVELFE
mgnify:CR=1 FL=1